MAFDLAIGYYTSAGGWSMAARFNKEVAEIHEAAGAIPAAVDYYQRAVDNHEQDGKRQAANSCLIKVATLASQSVLII